MTKRVVPFRQADVTRALKGAVAAGFRPARVEIDANGKIVMSTETAPPTADNAFDEWRAKRDARPS